MVIGGCAASPQAPTATTSSAAVDAEQYRATFDAGVAVLRDAGFQINQQDFRFGRISSEPQGSPTVLELWKPDNVRAEEAWLSTFGDLRRTVTISLEPGDEPAARAQSDGEPSSYRLRVEVILERLQIPQRRMNGRTEGGVFADLREIPTELRNRGIRESYWQPIGRDPAFEQYLTRKIFEQTQAPAS